ncbi:hybrid sensor histidine kinase/response regulator [Limimaricola litoreus]|uniref:histidine kinase n=1 Tax=Limimaricola litoreus TaxID=2955316 RepID=A0A9X2JQK7_9RHOB|nr:PAS domain-containing hybrid sensor histidine kinase/response regulator [Limimaricola litoreus]MCP1169425.1 ATP-binding protein [Limimaricola litoreus]
MRPGGTHGTARRRRLNIRTGLGIAAAIVLTMVLSLGWMLGRQIHMLDSAWTDNTQWTLAQLELENAIFARDVMAEVASDTPDIDGLKLRFDIMVSRLGLVRSGEIGRSLREDPEVPRLLAQIDAYVEEVDRLLAGEVDRAALREVYAATLDVQAHKRDLSLNGLNVLAEEAEAHRHEVRRQAEFTALAGGLLLILLGALLRLIDVQRRRVMERDRVLSQTADRLASVIGSSLDAIVVADHEGTITEFNPAAEEIFGWRKEEVLGRPVFETIVPADRREAFAERIRNFIRLGKGELIGAGRLELAAQRRNGEVFPTEAVLTSVDGPKGPVFIGYLRDITDLKASQSRLIDARDAAERADRAKSRFLAVMSHEMRTPLNGIMGVLDLLETTDLTADQRRKVGVALASAEILLQLVNESLDITRIETGEEKVETMPFSPGPMLQRLLSVLRPLAAEKDLPLELEADEADLGSWYEGDPNRVAQVVTNLIGNAIKFTERGSITVKLALEAGGVDIEVRDTGIGISPQDIEKVFAEFVSRARPEGRQGRSDGLGLAISRRLARLMGGDITVRSSPGKGSVFRLNLPLQRVPPPLDTPEPAAIVPVTPAARLSILVVEDNAVNRMVLRGMLQKFGHAVSEAQNGQMGVERLKAEAFDLVLMDFEMPVMGGIDATRAIRETLPADRQPPIIGLTAHGSVGARAAGLGAGMSEVYAKPLRLPVLRRLLAGFEGVADTPDAKGGLAAPVPAQLSPAETDEGLIDIDDFDEMAEMLGVGQLAHALERFEAEWHEAAPRLIGEAPVEDSVAALAHKLRGGAAMLAMSKPVETLGEMERRAPALFKRDEVGLLNCQVTRTLALARRRLDMLSAEAVEAAGS